jgi:hypothetical protein
MNWFRENRFLGTFAIVFGVAVLGAVLFLVHARGEWDQAGARFTNASRELDRLERLAPYPSAENLRKMKAHSEDYAIALGKLKEELKGREMAPPPLRPNEFQSQLRLAINRVTEKARGSNTKLPDKFYLGFDEFVAALPNESAAPVLGQELVQIEWLLSSLLDSQVDAVSALRRLPVPSAKISERNVVELTFFSTPAAARKVINQIAGANQHFCIIRELHVRNEKATGPPREGSAETPMTNVAAPRTRATPVTSLNFIVGTEKIETSARIEMVRFAF